MNVFSIGIMDIWIEVNSMGENLVVDLGREGYYEKSWFNLDRNSIGY